jgi:hypothetical protein
MRVVNSANTDRGALSFEQRRLTHAPRGAGDWLDEVAAEACGARAMTILLQAIARDADPCAIATARKLQQAFGDA